jgi:hypothetical protein
LLIELSESQHCDNVQLHHQHIGDDPAAPLGPVAMHGWMHTLHGVDIAMLVI